MNLKFIDTYKDLLNHRPPTTRDVGRKLVLDLVSSGYGMYHSMDSLFKRPRIQFLYIHHIFRDEEKPLTALLEALSRHHTFISHSEAVDRILHDNIDKPYICFSSDDGLKNNIGAANILSNFGAKACFFICPGIIGEKDFDRISEFSQERLHLPPVEFMEWKDVHDLQQQGHEIGGHTWSHINIAKTPEEDLEKEIEGCFKVLKEKCGSSPLHFAYPYGRLTDFTAYAREMVFRSGYASCASASRGCHIAGNGDKIKKEDLLLRRDHVLLNWPLKHILFFIARNSARATPENNFYPNYAYSNPDKQS